jgi:hypothetical protein
MTSAFLLPFAIGVCRASGNNVATDAFGTIAMVAMTPLIAIQLLGVVYKAKIKKAQTPTMSLEEIIDLNEKNPVFELDEETGEIQVISITEINSFMDNEIIDFD